MCCVKSRWRIRMKISTAALAVFVAGLLTAHALAQQRPDFSGAWSSSVRPYRYAPRGVESTASLGSGWGQSFTITQDADTLLIERAFFSRYDLQPAMKFRYALDGTESRNTVWVGRGEQVQISTSAWEGDKLVITTVYTEPQPGGAQPITCEVTQTLSLQPARLPAWPPSLVVVTVRHGVLGGPSSTTRTVYFKD